MDGRDWERMASAAARTTIARWRLTCVRSSVVSPLAVACLTVLLLGSVDAALTAQSARIDTVIVTVAEPFPPERASGFLPRTMNALHITTRVRVIRRTVLLRAGDPYHGALAAESERSLRAMQIFKYVSVDSVRLDDGRLALRVETRDSWTTSPSVGLGVGAGGTWVIPSGR